MRRRTALTLLAATAAGCRPRAAPPVDRLVVAAGATDEVYDALGTALAADARARGTGDARVLATGGATENLHLLADGRADLGFTTVDVAELARGGEAPFSRAVPVAALAGLYDDCLHVVVRADGPVTALAGLRGRRVGTGPAGSAAAIVADRLFNHADLGNAVQRLPLPVVDAAEALRRGGIDAFVFTGGLPTPAVARLARQVPVRLLPVGGSVADLRAGFGEYYVARSVPAGVYGVAEEVPTVGVRNVVAVRADLPQRTAYRLTALLFGATRRLAAAHEEARRLDQRSALATFPVPLHVGAYRYYRDAKPMA